MRLLRDHPRLRWLAPAAALVLVGTAAVAASGQASADSGLPPRTAEQLLVDLRQADPDGLSGTVEQRVDLGLPQLPGITGTGSAGGNTGSSTAGTDASALPSLLTGSHTWRVWTDGESRSRLALVSGRGESDVVRNGSDLWLWSSADNSAAHYRIPDATASDGAERPTPTASPTDLPRTPQEAAQRALDAVAPTTEVTTSGTATVAGRAAYELVLAPRDSASRVSQVRVALDGEQHVPLRVQVFASGLEQPAVDVGFTSVDFAVPDAQHFEFTPPAGATVTEKGTLPMHRKTATTDKSGSDTSGTDKSPAAAAEPTVVGSGWTTVVVASLPAQAKASLTEPQAAQVLGSLPQVSGSWGSGRLLDGTLFSAVLTDDGRVAVGAVDPQRLYAALSGG